MQGRQGQGKEPWDRISSEPHAALNGRGRERGIPQRPPRMARLDNPPQTPRIGRPPRESSPRNRRRRLLIFGVIFVACALLAGMIGYGLSNFFQGVASSLGAADTASNFLIALKSQNYDQAYQYLDATITISVTRDQFTQMARADDRCYGKVTDFHEVEGSATTSADNNTQSYTYSITRSKLSKPYQLTLTLQKDPDGNWDITSYGNDLGPAPPTCK